MSKIVRQMGLLLLALGLVSAGCVKKGVKKTEIAPEPEVQAVESENAGSIQLGAEWGSVPALRAVLFEPTKAELNAEARNVLKQNAAVLKAILTAAPVAQVRLEGHCDERNTVEYNLALGQRRAAAVKNYYAALGIEKKVLSTVSYGEERPVCRESTEACWWQNRRGETTVRSASGPIRIPRETLSSLQQ